jgi:hypothetical protein
MFLRSAAAFYLPSDAKSKLSQFKLLVLSY